MDGVTPWFWYNTNPHTNPNPNLLLSPAIQQILNDNWRRFKEFGFLERAFVRVANPPDLPGRLPENRPTSRAYGQAQILPIVPVFQQKKLFC